MKLNRGLLLTVALSGAIAGLMGTQLRQTFEPDATTPSGIPAPARAPFLTIGVTTKALARNADRPWTATDLTEVDAFERAANTHAGTIMWFADFAGTAFDPRQAEAVAARDAIPEISWEPWDASNPSANQPAFRLRTFLEGDHDPLIRTWARGIAAYGKPLRLRFGHEMNGRWYPWAERANRNQAGEFVRVWRHVQEIFDEEGATNVVWVWSPVAGAVTSALFPGEDHVDVVAVSGFNGGTTLFRQRWRSFETSYGPTLTAVHAMAPSKPVEISEIASAETGGDKATWITEMFASIRQRPYIRSLIWFELVKEADWRIVSSPEARAAFIAGAREAASPPAQP